MEYYDTDKLFYNIKKFNEDVETLKVVRPTAEERLQIKLYLNSLYGKMASCIHFIDGKENDNMIKDYILIHVDKEPLIIFKKQIVSIAKDEGRAYIQCTACGYLSDESYADIVKQAL